MAQYSVLVECKVLVELVVEADDEVSALSQAQELEGEAFYEMYDEGLEFQWDSEEFKPVVTLKGVR
jgi:hypothetical protein